MIDSPKHIAIICDGNRRWAKQRKMPVFQGHEVAADKTFEDLVLAAKDFGVEYITFWIFSTENWNRSKQEVDALMRIFRSFFSKNIQKLHKEGVKIETIGELSKFDQDIQEKVSEAKKLTSNNQNITVVFAMNYGGRDEIARAMKCIASKVQSGVLSIDEITSQQISQNLDTALFPDPDLLIRTGGEQRLSGYLPWQSIYSELYFTPVMFPDFDKNELELAIKEFKNRQRRFGK